MIEQSETSRPKPSRLVEALIVVAALVVLAGGTWGFVQSGDGGHDHEDGVEDVSLVGETVDLPEGLIRVDAVRPEIMAAMIMPASLMPDHVPDGYRRFAVDMTVLATQPQGLSVTAERFSISGGGLELTSPHREITTAMSIPQGNQASVSMLFQAPTAIDVLYLHIDGTEQVVLLEGALGDGHAHGEAPADIVIRGFFELEIVDFKFQPTDLIIATGTELRFHNHDRFLHDVQTLDGSFSTGDLNGDETSGVIRLPNPGTYSYFCSIHPTMTGTINIVRQ